MPTPLKTTENMRKHLTKAERQARQAAESSVSRPRVRIQAPAWLSDDARKIFEATKRRMKALQILDSSDADLLALYSDAIVRYKAAIQDLGILPANAQVAQSWSRLALSYAEKLGISATGRARLAKKKVENKPSEFETILDDVNEFVNSDVR